ncbi:MAG TPA: MotA/TolQ/ExbB proton channel family protein [Syntrophales bacterium]|nr:MotA/TolQ/ExbB proton channel family protein [Syntrophales bacterium]
MIRQALCAIVLLAIIFSVTFNLEVREMGLASNFFALLVVLGGTLAATLIAYPLARLSWTARLIMKSFTVREEMTSTIEGIVRLAHIYRSRGIRPLEQEAAGLPPGLLKTGVELIAYHTSRDKIEQILLKEALCTHNRCETSYKMLYNMARLAPALGLAGTIISLIRIFGHISDPQNLIGCMAVALLSTFYGVVLANVCFVPLSNKLREYMDLNELQMDIVQEGILDLCDQEHPRAIRYKLETLSATLGVPRRATRRAGLALVPTPEQAR